MEGPGRFTASAPLKRDLFGAIEHGTWQDGGRIRPAVRRRVAAAPLWTRPLACWLAAREARALAALEGTAGIPALLARSGPGLVRSWIDGHPLQEADPALADRAFFARARRLLGALHRAGVTHNDTAKEPNWVVTAEGHPALLDFQLAQVFRRRGRLFRLLAREDLRHLLKHKRTYCPEALTARERALLESPSAPAVFIRRRIKPIYTLVTRRLLRWQDREGRGPPPRPRADQRPPRTPGATS